jgi:hypothetical protein
MRIILPLMIMLSGCSAFPTFQIKDVCARVEVVDEDLRYNGQNVFGLAWVYGGKCKIKIERKHYRNETLGHEFRHCLDGKWHR